MSTYNKLPGGSSGGQSKPLQDLSNIVKEYEQKLKELRKLLAQAKVKKTKEISTGIMLKQDDIINLTNSIRALLRVQVPSSDKQMYDNLKKTADLLFKQYNDLDQSDTKEEVTEEVLDPEFVQRESISFQNAGDLDSEVLQDRLGDIKNLQKDFQEVNNLFKDVATLVDKQGEQLNESDKNVDTAVKETARANVELDSANKYQRSAKKKALCIFLIVLVVVGILVAVVVSQTA